MPLAAPSNIQITQLTRVPQEHQSDRSGGTPGWFNRIDFWATVSWTDNEPSSNHWFEVLVTFGAPGQVNQVLEPVSTTFTTSRIQIGVIRLTQTVFYGQYPTPPANLPLAWSVSVRARSANDVSSLVTVTGDSGVPWQQDTAFETGLYLQASNNVPQVPDWTGFITAFPWDGGASVPINSSYDPRVLGFVRAQKAAGPPGEDIQTYNSVSCVFYGTGQYIAAPAGALVDMNMALGRDITYEQIRRSSGQGFQVYVGFSTGLRTLTGQFIAVGVSSGAFTVDDVVRLAGRGKVLIEGVTASHTAVISLSGAPSWLTLRRRASQLFPPPTWQLPRPPADSLPGRPPATNFLSYELYGIPPVSGEFTATLTGVRVSDNSTATASVKITVVDSIPRTVIGTNASITKDGILCSVGDSINLALTATPETTNWKAEGLPPGLFIASGLISGQVTTPGIYFCSIVAQAENYDPSLPYVIKFLVGVGTQRIDSSPASIRSPWLLSQWELTDLHILARQRDVESTAFVLLNDEKSESSNEASKEPTASGKMALRLKAGDDVTLAAFFVDGNNTVFSMAPDKLRFSVRPEANVDDALIFESLTPPASGTQNNQTYYLIPVKTADSQRDTVLEWVEATRKNTPLPCVADVEWTKNGKTYSSKSFPVSLELDVTRP